MTDIESRPVSPDDGDSRLDRWLRRYHPGLSQGVIQKLCRTGQIRVDGKRVEASTRVVPGQVVRVPPIQPGTTGAATRSSPTDPRDARDLQERVLYRDDQVLVLDKPFGLAVQGGPGIARNLDGMLDALAFDAPERPKLVHRLDRDTTGVLVLARTQAAASFLAAAFRGREAIKLYLAICIGRLTPLQGEINAPLAKRPGLRGERVVVAAHGDSDAARALTTWRTLDSAGRRATLAELSPHTGRTHQLRVHCAALGCPILGDAKYGGADAVWEGFPTKLHLHAHAIRIPHPSGGILDAAAPLPPHLASSFKALGFAPPTVSPPRHHR